MYNHAEQLYFSSSREDTETNKQLSTGGKHWWPSILRCSDVHSEVTHNISMWKDTIKTQLQRFSIWSKERRQWAAEVSGRYSTHWTKDAEILLLLLFLQSSVCLCCMQNIHEQWEGPQGCRVVYHCYWPLVKPNQGTIHEPDSQLHWWWLCNAGSMLANIVYLTGPRWR